MDLGLRRSMNAIGLLCVVALSFWITLRVIDYLKGNYGEPYEIHIIEASYGLNCHASTGNATKGVSSECAGKRATCSYLIDVGKLGDPSPGCSKDFLVKWQCGSRSRIRQASAQPEAHGSTLDVSCPAE
jgi:hypothetical protein